MKPARSLVVGVVALGFAGPVVAPPPAYAAPAPCERAEAYAAQAGAELLRIDRLEVRGGGGEHPVTKDETPGDRGAGNLDPAADGNDSDTLSEGIGMLGQAIVGSVLRDDNGGEGVRDDNGSQDVLDDDNGGQGGGSVVQGDLKTVRLTGVGLGEARTAMVATAQVKSAAVARILDAQADGESGWTEPLLQQAPPTHAQAATRATDAGRAGPLKLGAGTLSGHAQWDPAMACGEAEGETTNAQSAIRSVNLLGGAGAALIRVPQKAAGVSTTALEGTGASARTVASATVTGGGFDLAGGRVHVRMLTTPSLTATMSSGGGEVRYRPAQIEVSGDGIATKRLDTAGQSVDVTLDDDAREAGVLDAAGLGDLRPASRPLPLPQVPGLPTVSAPSPVAESAPAGDRMRLHLTLGGVRQAEKGRAIAARAAAIDVSLTQGELTEGRGKDGYGGRSSAVALDFAVGLMEAAAVAPERMTPVDTSGTGGGLPITGPGVAGLALAGVAMLLTGVGTVLLGVRRRRSAR
ncbi:hypothetical protein [Actinoplanes subtropicus]|uniref:hypothetical protein n=1 Tax=Actinoplanes subtropicus TaxID=543632 RepID=UPI0004C410C9|nr:hypothetical protein [Actinoplanes subtropicus]